MSKRQWREFSPGKRAIVVTFGVVDLALRAWSIADLAKRPQEQVNGPKPLWATALSVVNSMCVLPAAYLIWGRRTH